MTSVRCTPRLPVARAGAAGEIPQDPAVHRPEREFAGLRLLPGALDVVEDPPHLRAREVRRQRQARGVAIPVHARVPGELLDEAIGAGVLPHDRVVDGPARGAFPHHRGLTLVGDPDRGDVGAREIRLRQGQGGDLASVDPQCFRIVFHPAGAGKDLFVLGLGPGHDATVVVEDDAATRRGPLIDRGDVSGHGNLSGRVVRDGSLRTNLLP